MHIYACGGGHRGGGAAGATAPVLLAPGASAPALLAPASGDTIHVRYTQTHA